MASLKVNLTKKIAGKRFCPVVEAANGRIKPDWVVVNGIEEHHPEGAYYLDWTEGGKRRRKGAGKSASSALSQKRRKEAELMAVASGIEIITEEEQAKRRRLDNLVASYLEEIKLTKKHKTFLAYNKSLEYLMQSFPKTYIEEIDRGSLLQYQGFLRDKKNQSPRSIANKFENVMTFLKAQGVVGLMRKGDWPTFVETEPVIYEPDELAAFFGACDPKEKLWYTFFLMTGMREQEVIYTMQRNISPAHLTVSMKWKPEFNWSPKGYKEREIPVPKVLIESLVEGRPNGFKGRDLLFSTASGLPKFDFLDCCKSIADRAGLDPADWWLHKFRATFATSHLQNGVDIRTVQKWMGHTDLESTMRYLKPARNEQVRARVDSTFA